MADEQKEQKPQMLPDPDFTALRRLCQEYIDRADVEGGNFVEDNDDDHYIYEAAIEAFFGEGVWDWLNNRPYHDDDETEDA